MRRDPAVDLLLGGSAAEHVDWDLFLRLVSAHGVTPLVCRDLGECPDVPEWVRMRLRRDATIIAARNLRLTWELLRLLRLLSDAGVSAVPFKGPLLAAAAYGDVVMREFGDLDLLVRPGDAPGALSILEAEGYLPEAGANPIAAGAHELRCAATGSRVELHWQFSPSRFVFALDAERVWPRVRSVDVLGTETLSLSDEDTVLYLALHGGKHCWSELKWLCDLAEFLRTHPRLDLERVMAEARAIGAWRACRLALHLSATLLGGPVVVEPDASGRRMARQVEAKLLVAAPPSAAEAVLMNLRLKDRMSDRARLLARQVTARTGAEEDGASRPVWLAQRYGTALLRAWFIRS